MRSQQECDPVPRIREPGAVMLTSTATGRFLLIVLVPAVERVEVVQRIFHVLPDVVGSLMEMLVVIVRHGISARLAVDFVVVG